VPHHSSFSSLPWSYASLSTAIDLEDDDAMENPSQSEELPRTTKRGATKNILPIQSVQNNFWLEEDDIVDF
jgi:hypothetical protein